MANKVQILNKIARDLGQLGVSVTQGATTVTVGHCIISYVDATIASPMGGVDGTASPFLGIGVANPGKLQIRGTGSLNTIATIFDNASDLQVLALVAGFANNILVVDGSTGATVLAELVSNVDLKGLGQ